MARNSTIAQSEPDDDQSAQPFMGLARYELRSQLSEISYYLCGDIQASHCYTELFHTLRTAGETDVIYLHLNTPGGDFDTGLQIINNMRASSAHIVTVLEARAYSMGALIFLAGDELEVHDNCQLMFHIYSGSFAGRGTEQQAQVQAVSSWFAKVMQRICQPFLSPAEIDKILKGVDVWMDSDEIQRRLVRMQRAQAKPVPPRRSKNVTPSPADDGNVG